jgi:hypothetical protein
VIDLSDISIVDHHAHPLSRAGATAEADAFRRWFSESTDAEIHCRHVPNTLFFRTAVHWLAEELHCAPALEDVLKARAAIDYEGWTKKLFTQANIQQLYCDDGYSGELAYSHEEMKALLPCEVRPILRLETLAEDLIRLHETFEEMVADFAQRVSRAKRDGYVALKSIIAYRSGLAIVPTGKDLARNRFGDLKNAAMRNRRFRLTDKAFNDYLIWLALDVSEEQGLPLQFHTGFGDRDADLLKANPLNLRTVIEMTHAPFVLLHAGWPYYREAAHLAAIYPHVWVDLSLAVPFATTGIPTMVRDVLGMAPFSKVMFATDAFTMPEIYWLAARWGRWGLSQVLEEMVEDGFLAVDEAFDVARQILGRNALALYGEA